MVFVYLPAGSHFTILLSTTYPEQGPSLDLASTGSEILMSLQTFTQELIDEILDSIGSVNKADIGTCGLVCKRWLPRSRFHLFSSITVSADNVDAFLQLSATSTPPLFSFVQSLTLYFGDPFDDAQFPRLLHFPRLTDLCVTVDGIEVATDAVYRSLQIHIPLLGINSTSLSRFHLEFYDDIPLSVLIDIISASPLLEFLRIDLYSDYSSNIIHDVSVLPACSLPHLNTFEISGGNSASPFFTWILSAPILPIFKSLTLHIEINGVNNPIEVYLQRVGPEIESLELEAPAADEDLAIAFKQRAVQHCCKLRHLVCQMGRLPSDILTLLHAISSSQLATLRIAVWLPDVEFWNALDEALSCPRFRVLRSFAVEERGRATEDNVFEINPELKLHMPLANARGILD
ncbi:hypothetical protein C8R44DRAFT_855345 [Mycena epipterygia]|nr:hypothetical protein C8R44DRAFT_855345 [Mycena epipterygia]